MGAIGWREEIKIKGEEEMRSFGGRAPGAGFGGFVARHPTAIARPRRDQPPASRRGSTPSATSCL